MVNHGRPYLIHLYWICFIVGFTTWYATLYHALTNQDACIEGDMKWFFQEVCCSFCWLSKDRVTPRFNDQPWPAVSARLFPRTRNSCTLLHDALCLVATSSGLKKTKSLGNIKYHKVPIVGVRNEGEYTPNTVCLSEKIDDQPWNLGVLYHTVPECTSCSIKPIFFPWQSCAQGMFRAESSQGVSSVTCSGHGECNDFGTCDCDSGQDPRRTDP